MQCVSAWISGTSMKRIWAPPSVDPQHLAHQTQWRVIFDFYSGLPHVIFWSQMHDQSHSQTRCIWLVPFPNQMHMTSSIPKPDAWLVPFPNQMHMTSPIPKPDVWLVPFPNQMHMTSPIPKPHPRGQWLSCDIYHVTFCMIFRTATCDILKPNAWLVPFPNQMHD